MRKLISYAYFVGLGLLVFSLSYACKKKELDPEEEAIPPAFFSASLDDNFIAFPIGPDGMLGEAKATSDSTGFRYWNFEIKDTEKRNFNRFGITFRNHQRSSNSLRFDLQATIRESNYQYVTFIPPDPDPNQLSRIYITYTDTTLKNYSSEPLIQENSKFKITAVEDVELDSLFYKKVQIEFECQLLELNTSDVLTIKNGRAVIFVGGIPIDSF